MTLSPADREALAAAVQRLESPSLAGRLAALAGKPVGFVQRALPATASTAVAKVAKHALERALDVALYSLRNRRFSGGRKLHSGLACTSGAIGGAFGLAALAVELPVSTTIMLRAIAAIAQEEGEDLADPRTGLACLEVFALGGPPTDERTGWTRLRHAAVGPGRDFPILAQISYRVLCPRGTDGSNPLPSSSESCANLPCGDQLRR
jgi:hypothetical protein